MDAPTATARRPKGITCPTCGTRLHTRRVIPLAGGTVRRVRVCRSRTASGEWVGCGHRCSTYETVLPPPGTGTAPRHP